MRSAHIDALIVRDMREGGASSVPSAFSELEDRCGTISFASCETFRSERNV